MIVVLLASSFFSLGASGTPRLLSGIDIILLVIFNIPYVFISIFKIKVSFFPLHKTKNMLRHNIDQQAEAENDFCFFIRFRLQDNVATSTEMTNYELNKKRRFRVSFSSRGVSTR
jgi:uncharacterized membrane-anchored protein YitT (DUF2179 family)